eukprot:gene3200-6319_t
MVKVVILFTILASFVPTTTSQENEKLKSGTGKQRLFDDIEIGMRYIEKGRMQDAAQQLKNRGISVKGFYHTSTWQKHWKAVITEQLRLMDGSRYRQGASLEKRSIRIWSSLLAIAESMQLTVAGTVNDYTDVSALVNSLDLKYGNKIKIVNAHTMDRSLYRHSKEEQRKILRKKAEKENLSEGEYATINSLHAYCKNEIKEGRKAFVYYAHNKGGCCAKGEQNPVTHWREEMNSFNLEFPSTCIRALLNGYKTCGVEYQDAHYSGNYWWADCSHVAALPGLWDPIDNAYACEYFIFNVSNHHHNRIDYAQNCGYNLFHCDINHYDELCPREKYLSNIMNYIAQDTLPTTTTATVGKAKKGQQWVAEKCSKAHEKPYIDQKPYSSGRESWWET